MRILFIALLILFYSAEETFIDKTEAKAAFLLINKVRQSPENYYKELKFNNSFKVTNKALTWNDTLAMVAEQKAKDMADRDYYGHVDQGGFGINYQIDKSGYKIDPDWIKNKEDNYFESIVAEVDNGEDAVKRMIIDEGIPSKGHRKHLLGNGDWFSSLVDIGIGFARRDSGSTYKNYVSVIIAKHN